MDTPAPLTAPGSEPGPVSPESPALLDSIQRDKLSLIGHMASSIAHELSNPLATIVASAQSILAFWPRPGMPGAPPSGSRDGWGPPPEFTGAGVPLRQLREDLELILAEARRAGDIAHGLLASARWQTPEWRIASVADVVRRTVQLCRHHLKLHNVALQAPHFDPHDGYPLWSRVRGDANQLQQVLLNLIINAQQAITAHRGYGTIRLTLGPDGPDQVVLTVEDDGPGVPASIQQDIFHPFYTTKPVGQGTGLGLSISAQIVRAHGGEISVDPHPGGGARFRIALPSLAASERQLRLETGHRLTDTAAPAIPIAAEGDRCRGRLLLVDDEPSIRKSVGRFLQRYGFEVTDVAGGQAAVHALRHDTYDLIVSDLCMPGCSGAELFALLEQEFPAMSRRILFTSGDLTSDSAAAFLKRTGCPALQKPYELAELVRVLKTLTQPEQASTPPVRRATA
jgi:two-component system NtrC family sensor kinase